MGQARGNAPFLPWRWANGDRNSNLCCGCPRVSCRRRRTIRPSRGRAGSSTWRRTRRCSSGFWRCWQRKVCRRERPWGWTRRRWRRTRPCAPSCGAEGDTDTLPWTIDLPSGRDLSASVVKRRYGATIDDEDDDDELPCWLKEKGRLPRSGVGGRNRVVFVVVSFTVL